MTLTQDFIGSFLEMLSICFFMGLFNDTYLSSKPKILIICFIVASVTTLTDDLLVLPVGYLINYVTCIVLLSVLYKLNFFNVFFEFIFTMAAVCIIQIILLFITSFFTGTENLSFPIRMLHVIIALTACILIGNSEKLKLLIRPFYTKYKDIIYLIAGNLFIFIIIQLYLWDSNHKIFLEAVGVITSFLILWCCINIYLVRKLVENHKQIKLIKIHEQYMEMTENLLNSLYAEKHEFKRHLQTISGMAYTASPDEAIKSIENYIESIEKDKQGRQSETISYKTGDSVISGLMYSKANEAIQNDIGFYYVPAGTFPEFPCEKYELVELIGNLIDNAFEYVKKLDPEERKVFIKIEPRDDKKCIEVSNTFYQKENEAMPLMSKKGYLTKTGERRGYGLYNVRRIVSKYNGIFNIFSQDCQLIIQILF